MRVAHICQIADPNIGGSLTVARALIKAQRKQGMDARLVFLYGGEMQAGRSPDTEYELFCQVDRRWRWLKGIAVLRRRLRSIAPDIIHHHDGILWPRLATAGLKRPLLTHGHLGRPQAALSSSSYWTHRYIAAHTDCLVAISDLVAESWVRGGFPRERTRLIPNGVDCERFHPRSAEVRSNVRAGLGLSATQKFVLWAGRLDRETKGLDRLVATARRLSEDSRLVVAGDGPARGWLAGEVGQLSANRRPILLGKVNDPADLFGAADAFLFTSKVETFGLVLLEAVASGLPIFAFECEGGGRELLRHLGGLVVAEGDVAVLAQAIASVSVTEANRRMVEQVRREYSWTAVERATRTAYAEFSARRNNLR